MSTLSSKAIQDVRVAGDPQPLNLAQWEFQANEVGIIAKHRTQPKKLFYPWSSIEFVELTTVPAEAFFA